MDQVTPRAGKQCAACRRHLALRLGVLGLCVLSAASCAEQAAGVSSPGASAAPSAATSVVARGVGSVAERVAGDGKLTASECRAELERLQKLPELPQTPVLAQHRAELFGNAKAVPVLFERPPELDRRSTVAQHFQDRLAREPSAKGLGNIYRNFYRRPELARAVFLREGYFYTDEPELAFALLQKVELSQLFDAPELVIQRGTEELLVVREEGRYRYASGTERGEPARILLYDRVWDRTAPPGAPLHVDVRPQRSRMGFDRFEVQRWTAQGISARLYYGGVPVETLFERHKAELKPRCELIPERQNQRVEAARDLGRRRAAAVAHLKATVDQMLLEKLPFDEPKTEEGQEDGKLRPQWRWAYLNGERSFKHNEDRYPVFDGAGRPRVPQVCIDFIIDTYERTSGTWWGLENEPRQRRQGGLLFDAFPIENPRSVEQFIKFAHEHPQWFDTYRLLPEERTPYYRRDKFLAHLDEHRNRYLPGDVVLILGLRDDERMHYHSFFIYDSDPVTQMPIWLASNAGRPRLRSWRGEMLSAPKRSIVGRVRPRLEWLEGMVKAPAALAQTEPLEGHATDPNGETGDNPPVQATESVLPEHG